MRFVYQDGKVMVAHITDCVADKRELLYGGDDDAFIVSSVSCIYGLGSPIDYQEMVISLRPGMLKDRDEVKPQPSYPCSRQR